MPEEETESTSEVDEQRPAAEGGQDEPAAKPPKTFGRRANSNLRVARRSLEAVDWQPDDRARHLLAEAHVLALLDLADAIRAAEEPLT